MEATPVAAHTSAAFVLCFQSLYHAGKRLAFPCDPQGHVNMDSLGDRALNNYLYARTLIGREFGWPTVVSGALSPP